MITFLATHDHRYTFKPIARRVRVLSYERLFRRSRIAGGTYVFTDMERLSAHELALAAGAAAALRDAGCLVLNDPARALSRGDLLARLRAAGINRFRAYAAAQWPKPERFPVLIKATSDHQQLVRELLADQRSLEAGLETLQKQGIPLRDLLVIEFMASPIRDGVFRKHSVFRAGDAFLSYTPVIEDSWLVKYGKANFSTDAELDEAIAEMETNPYAQAMRPVFEIAGVDYGRVDFGVADGGFSVFEINTNPSLPKVLAQHRYKPYLDACNSTAERVHAAILALPQVAAGEVSMRWPRPRKLRFDFSFRPRVKRP